MNDSSAKIIRTKYVEETPGDVAISRHIQNLFATYGEERVRESLKTLFGVTTKTKKAKKSA